MLFNSYIFVLLFLPLSTAGWFALNKFRQYRLASAFMLCMSLWFYAYFNIKYLPIIVVSILVNYVFYRAFKWRDSEKAPDGLTGWPRKLILLLSIVFNLGILFYFKYFGFFVDNINSIFGTSIVVRRLVLPLGVSFFTFQQMTFVIDSYDIAKAPDYDFLNYALFVTYFPQLIAGPIVTHEELVPQLQDIEKRKFNSENTSRGLLHFSLGLAKKVLIADVVGAVVDTYYAKVETLDTRTAAIIMLAYTIQLYFDFSGYSDMAMGLGRMINVELPVNFNSPYSIKSPTISDYWNRNHITLTRFFTKYVYIPLGGSRKGKLRMYLNTMAVFLLSGLWHGADWSFVIWGGIHGAMICLNKLFKKQVEKIPKLICWAMTFAFHVFTLTLFRAESMSKALLFYKRFFAGFTGSTLEMSRNFKIAFVVGFVLLVLGVNAKDIADRFRPKFIYSVITVALLVACILSFQEVSTFLYFNF